MNPPLENPVSLCQATNYPTIYAYCLVYNIPPTFPIPSQMNPVYTFKSTFFKEPFSYWPPIYPYLSQAFLSHFIRATWPAYLFLIDFFTLIKFCEDYELWPSEVCILFTSPLLFSSLLNPNVFLSHPTWKMWEDGYVLLIGKICAGRNCGVCILLSSWICRHIVW
jgi:hypothetical protein